MPGFFVIPLTLRTLPFLAIAGCGAARAGFEIASGFVRGLGRIADGNPKEAWREVSNGVCAPVAGAFNALTILAQDTVETTDAICQEQNAKVHALVVGWRVKRAMAGLADSNRAAATPVPANPPAPAPTVVQITPETINSLLASVVQALAGQPAAPASPGATAAPGAA